MVGVISLKISGTIHSDFGTIRSFGTFQTSIVPELFRELFQEFWNNSNCSKIFKLFQMAKYKGLQTGQIVPEKVPSRVCAYARALLHGTIYPLRDIYSSNVIRVKKIWNFCNCSKIPSEKLQRFALAPYGALAVIFPQEFFVEGGRFQESPITLNFCLQKRVVSVMPIRLSSCSEKSLLCRFFDARYFLAKQGIYFLRFDKAGAAEERF